MKRTAITIAAVIAATAALAQGAQILTVLYMQVRCKSSAPDSAPTDHVRIYCLTSDDHVRQINDAGTVIDLAAAGGGGNSFETQNVPSGTDPVADLATDTLNWTSTGATLTLTGDSVTDTINVEAVDVTCVGCLGSTEIAALDASDITTGTFLDARIDGAGEADELVLVGDVDGAANANDIDEVNVEGELETVLDLLELQDAAGAGSCTASQQVRRNAGDTAFECFTASSGAASSVEVTLDFGASGSDVASVVVTGQAWVTTSTEIACTPTLVSTADRAEGAEDAVIEGLVVAAHTRVAGTGFTLTGAPRFGVAIGRYAVHCLGV